MASSFILKSLETEKITEDVLQEFFKENKEKINKYKMCLSALKDTMDKRGGNFF